MRRGTGLGPQLLIGSLVLMLAIGVFLVARRAIGALAAPLPPLPLVTTALVVAAWAWSVPTLWRRSMLAVTTAKSAADHLVRWLPSASVLLMAVACSYPGRRPIDWLVWLPIVVIDWFRPWVRIGERRVAGGHTPARRSSPASEDQMPAAEDRILQQLTRVRRADGSEAIHGRLAACFSPGQRVVTLHVAFCPPLERLPHVEAEVADGPEATVKIIQVLCSGARIDVLLPRAADRAERVSVELLATEGRLDQ